MNIASTSVVMSQQQLKYQANLQVANMAKGEMEQTGQNIMKLLNSTKIEQSVKPHLGSNIDIKI